MWTVIRRSSIGSLLSETSAETNNDWRWCWHWHWMWSVIHTFKAKWFIFISTNFCSVTDAVEKFYIVESFYFILIELCISMRIFVWTGSSQCFMTQCTTETACLTPGVTMQGYKSQKCEISINHNLTRPAKQWIARQIIGILTRTKHGSHATISDQCLLPDHLLSRDPLVTQVWPGNLCTLPPLPTIDHHQPLAWRPLGYQHRGSETTSSYVESSYPGLTE